MGVPHINLPQGMFDEHCDSVDSDLEFVATNYGTHTTSKMEYYFVADPNNGLDILQAARGTVPSLCGHHNAYSAVTMPLPRRDHADPTPIPHRFHTVPTPFPPMPHRHPAVTLPSPCRHHTVTTLLPCRDHTPTMP